MTELIKLVRELLKRLITESPDIYKKLQWITGILTSLIGIALAANAAFVWGWSEIIVPLLNISLTVFLGGVVTFLTGIFAVSFTPVKDPKKLEKPKSIM